MDKFLLTNKNALVTGSSSGIGRATAELFVELGANVLITGRNEANLKAVKLSCLSKKCNENQKIVTFRADLIKEDEVRKLSEKTLSEFPVLDILVNNAGALVCDNLEKFHITQFDEHLNINLKSVIILTQSLTPSLIHSKGCIVNVSSDSAFIPDATLLTYCMGKAALDHFTRCISLELSPKGVRVNSVNSAIQVCAWMVHHLCIKLFQKFNENVDFRDFLKKTLEVQTFTGPGIVATDIFRKSGMAESEVSSFLEKYSSVNLLGRTGDVKEIAYAIAYLASPASSFTVGSILNVDGGQL